MRLPVKKWFPPLVGNATEPTRCGVRAQENGLAPLLDCLPFRRRSPRNKARNAIEKDEEQATCPSSLFTQADMGEFESLGSETGDEGKPQSLSRSHVPTFFGREEGCLEPQTQSVFRPEGALSVEEFPNSCSTPREDDREMPATASCEVTSGVFTGTGDGNGFDPAGFLQTSLVSSVLPEEEESFHSPLSTSLFSWFRETTTRSDCASVVTAMSIASCVEGPLVELKEDCEWRDWDLLLEASCEEGGILIPPFSTFPALLPARAEDNRRHWAPSPPESEEEESEEALDHATTRSVLEQESVLAIRKRSWRSMTRRAATRLKCGVVMGGRLIAKRVRRRKARRDGFDRLAYLPLSPDFCVYETIGDVVREQILEEDPRDLDHKLASPFMFGSFGSFNSFLEYNYL